MLRLSYSRKRVRPLDCGLLKAPAPCRCIAARYRPGRPPGAWRFWETLQPQASRLHQTSDACGSALPQGLLGQLEIAHPPARSARRTSLPGLERLAEAAVWPVAQVAGGSDAGEQ